MQSKLVYKWDFSVQGSLCAHFYDSFGSIKLFRQLQAHREVIDFANVLHDFLLRTTEHGERTHQGSKRRSMVEDKREAHLCTITVNGQYTHNFRFSAPNIFVGLTDQLCNDIMQHVRTPFPIIRGSKSMWTLGCIGSEGREVSSKVWYTKGLLTRTLPHWTTTRANTYPYA